MCFRSYDSDNAKLDSHIIPHCMPKTAGYNKMAKSVGYNKFVRVWTKIIIFLR